jgi:DNA transposition AAA+ family ATPase
MTTMNLKEKEAIRDALKAYISRYPSQNKAAASLNGVSVGTISQIINSKFDNISDEMFRNLRAQISAGKPNEGWNIVETPLFKDVYFALSNAQEQSDVTWVIAPAGSGKTVSAQNYIREHRNVYYLLCDEDMKKGDFIRELAQAVGIKVRGVKRIREILMMIIDELSEKECPLVIFDEGDKLSDNILHYFITLYNRLKDKTGIVFLSTSYMKRRMQTGIQYDKKGYQEIESRIGRKFYDAEPVTANDVNAIARANGIHEDATLARIIKDAEACKFDLRRVYKKVNAENRKKLAV